MRIFASRRSWIDVSKMGSIPGDVKEVKVNLGPNMIHSSLKITGNEHLKSCRYQIMARRLTRPQDFSSMF
jgi:hypothetical protein